jgi:hypothetical protein
MQGFPPGIQCDKGKNVRQAGLEPTQGNSLCGAPYRNPNPARLPVSPLPLWWRRAGHVRPLRCTVEGGTLRFPHSATLAVAANCISSWPSCSRDSKSLLQFKLLSESVQSQNRTDTRFSQKKVAKIRKLYGTGRYRQIDIAALFGTSQAAISQITRNAAWRE